MAHIAISLGEVGVELDDEDLDLKEVVKIGERLIASVVKHLTRVEEE